MLGNMITRRAEVADVLPRSPRSQAPSLSLALGHKGSFWILPPPVSQTVPPHPILTLIVGQEAIFSVLCSSCLQD